MAAWTRMLVFKTPRIAEQNSHQWGLTAGLLTKGLR